MELKRAHDSTLSSKVLLSVSSPSLILLYCLAFSNEKDQGFATRFLHLTAADSFHFHGELTIEFITHADQYFNYLVDYRGSFSI
jgi:hypothetical protein